MKNLVVFDLEMNQGYKPYTFDYCGVEQNLRGEIIQIGAAKVDENFKVLDTFSVTMKPKIFRKLHHHVAKVTGLTKEILDAGCSTKEGVKRFLDWCGEDCVLLEWGLDDVPVLKQNLLLLGLDVNFPQDWYDVQQMVSAQFPPAEGEKMNLEAVVERLEVPQERPFHDALCDVLYTCEVAQRLDAEKAFASYPTEEMTLLESLSRKGEVSGFTLFRGSVDGMAWKQKELIGTALCPHCGGKLIPADFWGKWASHCHYSLCSCENCEQESLLLVKGSKKDGLHWCFARAVRAADEENKQKWLKEKSAAEHRRKQKEAACKDE